LSNYSCFFIVVSFTFRCPACREFENIGQRMLTPVIEALRPIANINIESQVLYHTPKSSYSYSDDKLGGNVLSVGDIPFFVNSNEWHLDTSISATGRSKVLQFVVYVL
jgi:phosphatidylinositol glycan class S